MGKKRLTPVQTGIGRSRRKNGRKTSNATNPVPGAVSKTKSIKHDLGLRYEILRDVAVPKEVITRATSKMRQFKQNVGKNKTPKFVDSVRLVFTKKDKINKILEQNKYEDEKERRARLDNAFKDVLLWMTEATVYFDGCAGAEKLKKYCDEIDKSYQKLNKKGYLSIQMKDLTHFVVIEKAGQYLDESYQLDFVKEEKFKIETDAKHTITIPGIDEKDDYKTRCLKVFQDLRFVFSAYLSEINEIYTNKFQGIDDATSGTLRLLEQYREEIDTLMPAYEHFVVDINNELQENKTYFKLIADSQGVKNLYRDLDDKRTTLKNLVADAKEALSDANFVPSKEGDYNSYKELASTLKAINNDINKVAKYISEGNYEGFKKTYPKILEMFKSTLPKNIKKFKEVTLIKDKIDQDNLKKYKDEAEKISRESEEVKAALERYIKDFRAQYSRTANSFIRNMIPAAISSSLAIGGQFFKPLETVGKAFDNFAKAIKDTNNSVPKLN